MNFAGIGLPEMAVIFLVMFLVLGPSRAISMIRTAGKVLGDLKRTFNQVAAAASLEQREHSANRWSSPPESQPQDREEEPPARSGDE